MFIIFSVFYILIAAAMTVLILLQRGEGANAGASFGGGSSGTMFGARGAATFLSRSTAVLAGLFCAVSLGMAVYLVHAGSPKPTTNLGVMSGVSTTSTQTQPAPAPKPVPAPVKKPASTVPQSTVAPTKPAQGQGGSHAASAIPQPTVMGKTSASSGQGEGSSTPDKN